VAFPNASALDNFNRSNANPIGGNWATMGGRNALQISSNLAAPTSGASGAYYTGTLPGLYDEVFATLQGHTTNGGLVLYCRAKNMHLSTRTAYAVSVSALTNDRLSLHATTLVRYVAGVSTTLATLSGDSGASGYKYGVQAVGSDVSVWRDSGSGWTQILSASDSTIVSGGQIGLEVTTWQADDFGGDAVPPPPPAASYWGWLA
jgi:hypothetical protein